MLATIEPSMPVAKDKPFDPRESLKKAREAKRWTRQEKALARDLLAKGLSLERVAEDFSAKGIRECTGSAVGKALNRKRGGGARKIKKQRRRYVMKKPKTQLELPLAEAPTVDQTTVAARIAGSIGITIGHLHFKVTKEMAQQVLATLAGM